MIQSCVASLMELILSLLHAVVLNPVTMELVVTDDCVFSF